jgi:hypothetical protein
VEKKTFMSALRILIRDPVLFYPWIQDPDPGWITGIFFTIKLTPETIRSKKQNPGFYVGTGIKQNFRIRIRDKHPECAFLLYAKNLVLSLMLQGNLDYKSTTSGGKISAIQHSLDSWLSAWYGYWIKLIICIIAIMDIKFRPWHKNSEANRLNKIKDNIRTRLPLWQNTPAFYWWTSGTYALKGDSGRIYTQTEQFLPSLITGKNWALWCGQKKRGGVGYVPRTKSRDDIRVKWHMTRWLVDSFAEPDFGNRIRFLVLRN